MSREQRGDDADGLSPPKRLVHLQQAQLVVDVQPVTALGFDRRDAQLAHRAQPSACSGRRAPRCSRSRVAATVRAMPPPRPPSSRYVRPRIRSSISSARQPANARWVWQSMRPGTTSRPPRRGARHSGTRPEGCFGPTHVMSVPRQDERRTRDGVNRVLPAFVATAGEKADVGEDRHQCQREFGDIDHRQIDVMPPRCLERFGIAGVGVTHHAGPRVGRQHALQAPFGRIGARRPPSPFRRESSSRCRRRRRDESTPSWRRTRC